MCINLTLENFQIIPHKYEFLTCSLPNFQNNSVYFLLLYNKHNNNENQSSTDAEFSSKSPKSFLVRWLSIPSPRSPARWWTSWSSSPSGLSAALSHSRPSSSLKRSSLEGKRAVTWDHVASRPDLDNLSKSSRNLFSFLYTQKAYLFIMYYYHSYR